MRNQRPMVMAAEVPTKGGARFGGLSATPERGQRRRQRAAPRPAAPSHTAPSCSWEGRALCSGQTAGERDCLQAPAPEGPQSSREGHTVRAPPEACTLPRQAPAGQFLATPVKARRVDRRCTAQSRLMLMTCLGAGGTRCGPSSAPEQTGLLCAPRRAN